MLYVYYMPIASSEHMLYLTEIAKKYGIINPKSGKPHGRLIGAIFDEYQEETHHIAPELFYSSGNMNRVYPQEFYSSAIDWFKKQIKMIEEPQCITLKGISYNFKILS